MRPLLWLLCAGCNVAPPTVPWARSYGGTGRETATSLAEATNGGVLLAGVTQSSFNAEGTHPWLVRLSESGSLVWQEMLAGAKSETQPLLAARAGGFVMVANTYSDGAGKADIWVVSLNDDGAIAWQKTFGGISDDLVAGVTVGANGSIAVVGTTRSFGAGDADWLFIRIAADGSEAQAQTFGDSDEQIAGAIARFSDDTWIVAGQTTALGDSDAAFAFVDAAGTFSAPSAIGGTGLDLVTALSTEDDTFTLLASTTSFGAGGSDAWVLQGRRNGTINTQRTLGGSGEDRLLSLRSNWALGTTTVGSDSQLWLVGLATGGAVTAERAYGGSGADDGAALGEAPNGDLWLHGTTSSFGNTGPDLWLVRLGTSLELFQLGASITTQHSDTHAKPRPLSFTANVAQLVIRTTKITPTVTNGRVMPTVGN